MRKTQSTCRMGGVSQSTAPLVTVDSRIRKLSDSHAIQYYEDNFLIRTT